MTNAAGRLAEAPIYIDDSPALSVLEARAKARRMKAEHGLDLIVIDYLQLMRGRNPENRQQEISEISRSLKALAKELAVPVVALSQLSRAVEARQSKEPQLSDLRESGALEQDADVILFLYRPERYGLQSEDGDRVADIIVGKQRNGPTGKVQVTFIPEFASFERLARPRRAPAVLVVGRKVRRRSSMLVPVPHMTTVVIIGAGKGGRPSSRCSAATPRSRFSGSPMPIRGPPAWIWRAGSTFPSPPISGR